MKLKNYSKENGLQFYLVDIVFRSRVAWNSIYHKFRFWCAQDVFDNILKVLVADTEKYLLVQIDSTFCKIHQHATDIRKKKAFCSAQIRDFIQAQGGIICISDKANSRILHEFDKELYKARNDVECFVFDDMKNFL